MDRIATIWDMRDAARRNMPRPIFNYMDGAAFHEVTLRANTDDFEKIRFRLRPMRDVANRKISTTIMGEEASMPAVTAPIGLGGVMWGNDGEKLVARAAEAAGIPFTLGMLSIATIEEVRAQVSKPFWFQICMFKDRGLNKALMERALEAGSTTVAARLRKYNPDSFRCRFSKSLLFCKILSPTFRPVPIRISFIPNRSTGIKD